ncbi:unnamed protein product [Urochloa humidicola]
MAPAPAEGGVAPAAASASRRRRASWGAVLCLGSRHGRGEEAPAAEGATPWPWERWSRRRKRSRTVPVVDGDMAPGTAADLDVTRRGADGEESRKGLCCGFFLAPARTAGRRKRSTMDSGSGRSTHDRERQPEHTEQQQQQRPPRSPAEAADGSRSRRAEQPRGGGAPAATRTRTRALARPSDNEEATRREASGRGPPCPKSSSSAGVGAFGPVVGLSVVAAVSMAGLLGGRLWAVACVCAWLAALSGIRRREAGSGAAGSGGGGGDEEAMVAHVDSRDYKKQLISEIY